MVKHPDKIANIEKICHSMGIPEYKIRNIANMIQSAIPLSHEIEKLPESMTSGFAPFDYLIAPFRDNSRIHIYGRESTAKTAIITHILHCLIKKLKIRALWLDSTFKLNKKFFNKFHLGNNLEFIQSSKIDSDIIDLITSGTYNVLIIDDIASFWREEAAKMERILHYCKITKVLTLLANQVRQDPKNSKLYTPKQELMANYDIVLHTQKYAVHYDKKYNDFELKMRYHKQTGMMDGRSIIIPITTTGMIKEDLMDKRIDRMVKADGFDTFDNMIKHREMLI